MIRYAMMTTLALTLGGCMVVDREAWLSREQFYTRGDVDAINNEIQCRTLARNLVQVSRCGVRR